MLVDYVTWPSAIWTFRNQICQCAPTNGAGKMFENAEILLFTTDYDKLLLYFYCYIYYVGRGFFRRFRSLIKISPAESRRMELNITITHDGSFTKMKIFLKSFRSRTLKWILIFFTSTIYSVTPIHKKRLAWTNSD